VFQLLAEACVFSPQLRNEHAKAGVLGERWISPRGTSVAAHLDRLKWYSFRVRYWTDSGGASGERSATPVFVDHNLFLQNAEFALSHRLSHL